MKQSGQSKCERRQRLILGKYITAAYARDYGAIFSRYFDKIFSLANFLVISRRRVIKNDRGNSMETRRGEWPLCVRELLAGRLPNKLVKNWSKVSHLVGNNQIVTIIWGLGWKRARIKEGKGRLNVPKEWGTAAIWEEFKKLISMKLW